MREDDPTGGVGRIYLDNAATSFPKAPGVADAMVEFLAGHAGNPGRGGHAFAREAQAAVWATRLALAGLIGAPEPNRIAFGLNATDALNTALWGILQPGDRVVTTSMEHNAVVRPLRALEARGVEVTRVQCAADGSLDLDDLDRALDGRRVRLLVLTHASNVTGTILPVAAAAQRAHEHGAIVLVDAAQTAGAIPIDAASMDIDLLAFPGHKGLLGPTGTGALYVASNIEIEPLRHGGTGTHSEEERQPREMPEALEAGTVNTVGIAGLGAAIRYIAERGVEEIARHERSLMERLVAGLCAIPGIRAYGPTDPAQRAATLSVQLEDWEPVDLAAVLDTSFGVATRPGLHCAPWAHRTIGTFPRGTLRLSIGPFTTEREIDRTIAAFEEISTARG